MGEGARPPADDEPAGGRADAGAAGSTPRERPLSADDELVGAMLAGRYKVLAPIGAGGMGRVYTARDTRLADKLVAVKVLRPEHAQDPSLLARFDNEVRLMAKLPNSPHLLPVTDYGREKERAYFVSRLLQGCDLRYYIRRSGGLTYAETLRVLKQLLKGLRAAHRQGIVHRDLKPENVFVETDPDEPRQPIAVILDLGVARLIQDHAQTLTQEGTIVGTPAYLAPELFRPGSSVPHPRMDVYSVGLLAYECITAEPMWGGRDLASLQAVHATPAGPVPPLLHETEKGEQVEVPPAFSHVVARALAPDPDQRFQDAGEFLEALERIEGSRPEALPVGTRIKERYEIVRVIESGGGGTVYEVEDFDRDDRAALKMFVPLEGIPVSEQEVRFDGECDVLMSHPHPHIVGIRDKDRLGGWPYYVMELVEGISLRECAHVLGWDGIVKAFGQVAAALDHVHARGVIHRDIKPDNILIEKHTGRAKLIDFGIARREGVEVTATGVRLGTTGFQAPEQLTGACKAVPQSDQWALAATAYTMLTNLCPGQKTDDRKTDARLIDAAVINDDIVALAELRPDLVERAPALVAAIDRALAHDPRQRFETVAAFAAAVAPTVGKGVTLHGGPTAAGSTATAVPATETPMTSVTTREPSRSRSWRSWAIAGAAALVGAAALTYRAWPTANGGSGAAEPASSATEPRAAASADAGADVSAAMPELAADAAVRRQLVIRTTERGRERTDVAIEVDGQALTSPATIDRPAGTTVDVVVVDRGYRRLEQPCVVDEGTCVIALRPRRDGKPNRSRRRLEDKVDDVEPGEDGRGAQ